MAGQVAELVKRTPRAQCRFEPCPDQLLFCIKPPTIEDNFDVIGFLAWGCVCLLLVVQYILLFGGN